MDLSPPSPCNDSFPDWYVIEQEKKKKSEVKYVKTVTQRKRKRERKETVPKPSQKIQLPA